MELTACCLYLPVEKPDLKAVLPKARSNGSFLRHATWYEVDTPVGPIRMTIAKDPSDHLKPMRAYVSQQFNAFEARAQGKRLLASTNSVIGVVFAHQTSPKSSEFEVMLKVLAAYGGFMFVTGNILLPDGSFLLGPLAEEAYPLGDAPIPSWREVDPRNFKQNGPADGCDPTHIARREQRYVALAERGFISNRWLPLHVGVPGEVYLRPLSEIVARLFALKAVVCWIVMRDGASDTDELLSFIGRNSLLEHMTPHEREIIEMTREDAKESFDGNVGWFVENMWPLAWICGFEPAPPFYEGRLGKEMFNKLVFEYVPGFDASIAEFISSHTFRDFDQVADLEDLYYCAHNAVRSATFGEDSIPIEFHPVADGGAIHERRHSLTWAITPEFPWEETDLST